MVPGALIIVGAAVSKLEEVRSLGRRLFDELNPIVCDPDALPASVIVDIIDRVTLSVPIDVCCKVVVEISGAV